MKFFLKKSFIEQTAQMYLENWTRNIIMMQYDRATVKEIYFCFQTMETWMGKIITILAKNFFYESA